MLIRLHVRVLNARREDELGIPLEGKLGVMKNALAEVVLNTKNATGPDTNLAVIPELGQAWKFDEG